MQSDTEPVLLDSGGPRPPWDLLLANAAVGLAILLRPEIFETVGPAAFLLGVWTAGLTLARLQSSLLWQARLALLVSVGYYAGMIKALDPLAAFSVVETSAQTSVIGARMFALTSLALLAATAGLIAGGSCGPGPGLRISRDRDHAARWLPLFFAAAAGVLLAGYFSAESLGPSVFEAPYATVKTEDALLGNFQSIGGICLVLAFLASSRLQQRWTKGFLALLTLYLLGWAFLLRGIRQEALSAIFALFILLPASVGRISTLPPRSYPWVLLVAVLTDIWGTMRQVLATPEATFAWASDWGPLTDAGIYHLGTMSAIASTFSSTLHMLEHRVLDFQLGRTYIDYLLRSPPAFVWPDRPSDLSALFTANGYDATGGFFELAEAYLNFGTAGCLIVPFAVSFVLSRLQSRCVQGSWPAFFVLTGMLSVFLRGAWYQTFAYYKGALTAFLLLLLFLPFQALLRPATEPRAPR